MAFWAISFIWFKVANEVYSPMVIVYLRLLVSVLIVSLFLLVTGKFEKIRKGDMKLFIMMAFCEPFIYFIGESFGLTFVSPTVAAVVITMIPVFTAVGGWIFFSEKLLWLNYIGIFISLAGVLIFVINPDGSLSFDHRGLLLLSVAVLGAVGYTLILRRLAGSYSPVFIVNVQNIIGVILFTPVMLATETDNVISFEFVPESFWSIVKLAVFASSGAFILFGYAVRNLGATKANVFSNAIPVFTAIFAFFILGDSLSFQQIAGMVIVIAGLFMSQTPGKKWTRPDGTILAGKTA